MYQEGLLNKQMHVLCAFSSLVAVLLVFGWLHGFQDNWTGTELYNAKVTTLWSNFFCIVVTATMKKKEREGREKKALHSRHVNEHKWIHQKKLTVSQILTCTLPLTPPPPTHTHTHKHTHTNTCMHTHTHTRTHTRTHTNTHTCTQTHSHTCTHAQTHAHTHTHTE